MSEQYNAISAFHYAAYRPSLHAIILSKCLGDRGKRPLGLDVGCGTGQSALALTAFCEKVTGIEPSRDMLDKALKHPDVTYIHYSPPNLDFPDNYFDVVTFAGSLFYAKSQATLDAVSQIGKEGAMVIVYDFNILQNDILKRLNVDVSNVDLSNYNHEVNFDGLDQRVLKMLTQNIEHFTYEITNNNVAHLLLSDYRQYNALAQSLGLNFSHQTLSEKLTSIFDTETIPMNATIYYTVYEVSKKMT